jgi:GT2 family glycosyltransferase
VPFFRAAEKLVYFARVPKCAGSAVEQYLRQRFGALGFVDDNFLSLPQSLHWSRSSPQHVPVSILERLFPADFFDAAFTVVRHPVDRLVSEFHYLRDHLRRIDQSESFSSWVSQLDRAIAATPWLYDNHLRLMTEMVPASATVFRLEDGLDTIAPYLDGLVGPCDSALQFNRVLTRDPSIQKVVPKAEDIATIERIYRQDFDRFGYAVETETAFVLSPPSPPPVAAVRSDRSALAAEFLGKGIGYFRDGNIPEAHANFRFALNCAPEDVQTYALIANTALRLGALHLALDYAAKALERQPDQLDALLAVAGARLRLKHPKARESVDNLAPFEQLGDFRSLLRIAADAVEGNYEAALVEVADYLEIHPEDIFAGELVDATLRTLRADPDKMRLQAFLDGVGVWPEEGLAGPLNKPDAGQAACVDIIIPVFNALDEVKTCLESIRRWPSKAIRRIVLVDDCSAAETAAWLADYRDRHDDVQLVRNPENLGFTRAVMAGVDHSRAPYMLFLHSDSKVTSHWLDGMLEAMRARPQTALVGPLSNNAFHQSICPVAQGEAKDPWERTADDFAAMVHTITKRAFPRVPLLSGFCLLVHRSAFDLAGGLDSVAFPYGNSGVQDLCLKICDLGFNSAVADNVYVHHQGSGSIGKDRRDSLMASGRLRMFERYSALRVLTAETVSAMEPEVARYAAAWGAHEYFSKLGVKEQHPDPTALVFGPKVGQRCLKSPHGSMVERELCLFVTHCPLGLPHEYTLSYLAELKRAGLLVIVCLVVEDVTIPVADSLMELADGVLLRENGGYDFGAWADVLRRFPQAWGAGRLYFANDSVLGPFRSLSPLIDSIRDRNAGFFAFSECTMTKHHAQSFFFGWNQVNLAAVSLRRFWEDVVNFRDKDAVILNYEFGLSHLSLALTDPTQQIVFGFQQIFGCAPADLSGVNPTHNGWKRLLTAGFPFVKTDLLRDGVFNVDSSDWESFCATHGADPEALHRCIEASRINRLHIGKVRGRG